MIIEAHVVVYGLVPYAFTAVYGVHGCRLVTLQRIYNGFARSRVRVFLTLHETCTIDMLLPCPTNVPTAYGRS